MSIRTRIFSFATAAILLAAAASMQAQPAPSIDSFTATPSTISAGQSSTLSWSTSNASSVTLNDGAVTVPVSLTGSISASPSSTTVYTLTASNTGGASTTKTVTVTVVSAPSIASFAAAPATITAGQASVLSWSTSGASSVTLNDGSSTIPVALSGSVNTSPSTTTTYTLTAANSLGTSTSKTVTVTVVPAASIPTFTATPPSINPGQSALLTWTTSNATTITLSDGSSTAPVAASGAQNVAPTVTTTYTLTATNSVGTSVSKSVTVTVTAIPAVSITSFTATPSTIDSGQSSTLSWTTANAASVSIDNGIGAQPPNGSVTVSPTATTTYTLTATNAGGSAVRSVTLSVNVVAARKLQILLPGESAAPGTATGKSGTPKPQVAGTPFNVVVNAVNATWNVLTNVNDKVAITSSDAAVALAASGQLSSGTATFSVTLKTAGSQTLQVSDLSDSTMPPAGSASFTVTAASAAAISVARYPTGMLALPNSGGATDSYTLVNTGGATASIALTQSGNFFTQTPTAFTIVPGQSQQVTITAVAQPAGTYSGTSNPAGDGVASGLTIPIRLLVAAPPAGKPDVRPVSYRIDTNELVTTGTAAFQNVGDGAATGTFTADVPWLIPQITPMTIAAGATASGSFTIDRSLRPDAAAQLGEQTARFRFVYFSGSASQPVTVLDTQPAVGTATVTLVDTVGVKKETPAGIPPLLSGQIARFIMGIAHQSGRVTDLSLVNAGSATLSDFHFYFVPAGNTSNAAQTATVSQVTSNSPIGMGDVVSTVFRSDGVSGSMQLRSAASDLLSIHARLLDQSSATRSVGTALSILRSDAAAGAGESIFLTGLRKDARTRTDLYIQEAGGFAASAQVDFFDANGATVGTGRTIDVIGAFSQIELPDVVPAGAVVARIVNKAGSQGRLVAEAHAVESGGDVWTVVDGKQSGASRTEPVIIPLAATAGSISGTYTATDLYITNVSAANASANLTLPAAAAGRKRAVRKSVEGLAMATQSLSFAPMQTRVLTDVLKGSTGLTKDGRWFIGFTPSSGEFVVTSRTYVATSGQSGTIGSSVPAVGASSAMKNGDTRSAAGLEDSSAQTITSRSPGTYRSAVGLVETGGSDTTVRLTIRYVYSYASTTQRPPAVSADFKVPAGQLVIVDDLVRSIVGSQRDSYGDLHNIQLDVAVVSGSGAIIPFVVSTDNGSGDFSFTPVLR